mgnify:CR=1 FL=1
MLIGYAASMPTPHTPDKKSPPVLCRQADFLIFDQSLLTDAVHATNRSRSLPD